MDGHIPARLVLSRRHIPNQPVVRLGGIITRRLLSAIPCTPLLCRQSRTAALNGKAFVYQEIFHARNGEKAHTFGRSTPIWIASVMSTFGYSQEPSWKNCGSMDKNLFTVSCL